MHIAMNDPIHITIDRVGRVVIPKEIREEAGIDAATPLQISCREGQIVIEARRRPIRIEKRGRLQVAVSVETGAPLTRTTVRTTQSKTRRGD